MVITDKTKFTVCFAFNVQLNYASIGVHDSDWITLLAYDICICNRNCGKRKSVLLSDTENEFDVCARYEVFEARTIATTGTNERRHNDIQNSTRTCKPIDFFFFLKTRSIRPYKTLTRIKPDEGWTKNETIWIHWICAREYSYKQSFAHRNLQIMIDTLHQVVCESIFHPCYLSVIRQHIWKREMRKWTSHEATCRRICIGEWWNYTLTKWHVKSCD